MKFLSNWSIIRLAAIVKTIERSTTEKYDLASCHQLCESLERNNGLDTLEH